MTSYPMAIVIFTLFLTVCDIFASQEKYQNFDLENEGQCQEVEDRTCPIRLEMYDFI